MSDEKHLEALRTYWKANQCLPSYAGICEVVGLKSKSGVFELVGRLVEAGFIERVGRRLAPTRKFFGRPLVASVRAGLPEPATDEGIEILYIDDYLVDDPNRTVLCKVRGDSMTGAGLLAGDIVVVERNAVTRPNDIVVANVDGELTVKTLKVTATGSYYLEAANPAYPAIHPKGSLEIIGVVVGSFRRIRK
ncbi:LexA family protein [Pseudazoarcus pumilus]|uniref:LexA family transcriptional regulator n=1 Tax=Pseudazoarcus pumilus TaxID=2067960 RepID=A0A2I6S9C3_9RHOO|nr:S24 family peptidase [Pseudazoarcus pumilus]AUN95857.1 LexA family transcriptional regulator [Pseudazoarcus pumilus]